MEPAVPASRNARNILRTPAFPPGAPFRGERKPDGIDVGITARDVVAPARQRMMTIDQAWGGARPRQLCDGARMCGSAWSTTAMVEMASVGGRRNCAEGVMNWPLWRIS